MWRLSILNSIRLLDYPIISGALLSQDACTVAHLSTTLVNSDTYIIFSLYSKFDFKIVYFVISLEDEDQIKYVCHFFFWCCVLLDLLNLMSCPLLFILVRCLWWFFSKKLDSDFFLWLSMSWTSQILRLIKQWKFIFEINLTHTSQFCTHFSNFPSSFFLAQFYNLAHIWKFSKSIDMCSEITKLSYWTHHINKTHLAPIQSDSTYYVWWYS